MDSVGVQQAVILGTLILRPVLAEPIRRYVNVRLPWLNEFCEKRLSLVPGYPLDLGGIPWQSRRGGPEGHEDLQVSRAVARSGRGLSTSLI